MKHSDLEPNEKSMLIAIAEATKEYNKYSDKCKRNDYMVVVDYTQPSYRKRLYVVDIESNEILRIHHCSHGSGSADPKRPEMAIKFSNTPSSYCTSLGSMVTLDTYRGKHGYSCRLQGLEDKNNNVLRRNIVIHGATYVSDVIILKQGYAGRSQGCPAVDTAISNSLIQMINNGCFFFAYYY